MNKEGYIRSIVTEAMRYCVVNEAEGNVMEPTVPWMTRKYDEFNQMIFDGFLPKCKLAVAPLADNTLGNFRINHTASQKTLLPLGAALYADGDSYIPLNTKTFYRLMSPKITLNSKYARSEEDLENTLIHEMCHYYNYFNEKGEAKIPDAANDCHGDDFVRAAQLVSQKTEGAVSIEQLVSAEKMKQLTATKEFNRNGENVVKFDYEGQEVFFITKEASLIDSYKRIFRCEMRATDNPTLLMHLRRNGCRATTGKTFMSKTMINAYTLKGMPPEVKKEFDESEWVDC